MEKKKNMSGICLRTWIISAIMLLCFGVIAGAEEGSSPERLFESGNEHYAGGEYSAAIEKYNGILDGENKNAHVYYNLANAYFKSGKMGMAILNYKRAKRILPRDADINANYKFARAGVGGKIIPDKGILSRLRLRSYSESLTTDELTLLASSAYVIIMLFLFVIVIFRDAKRMLVFLMIPLFLYMLFNTAVISQKIGNADKEAVIIAPGVEALFAPFETATKFFILNEGLEVKIISAKDGWRKIKRSDGKTGWVREDEIEKV